MPDGDRNEKLTPAGRSHTNSCTSLTSPHAPHEAFPLVQCNESVKRITLVSGVAASSSGFLALLRIVSRRMNAASNCRHCCRDHVGSGSECSFGRLMVVETVVSVSLLSSCSACCSGGAG